MATGQSPRLESLEVRLNLSTLAGTAQPDLLLADPTLAASPSVEADLLNASDNQNAAQVFFSRVRKVKPTPTPTPTPTPDPAPTPDPVLPAVTITTRTLGTLTQLAIVGTSSNDSILVAQSGNTLTVIANGRASQYTGAYGEIMVHGGTAGGAITIDSSVSINTLLYAGSGATTITARGSGTNVIVTLGNGAVDTVQGNSFNTSYWADVNDVVLASSIENAAGRVHRIASFYQPWTSDTSSADYISTRLNVGNLRDPGDVSSSTRLSDRSLWGSGPTMSDVNQGAVGDCYFLADIQGLADKSPDKLRELAVDLGDGTYAVQFVRNGVKTYIRVDGDLPTYSWGSLEYARPGASGSIWAPILEKAYAFFRTGANTYGSLSGGWVGVPFSDFGFNNQNVYMGYDANTLYNTLAPALAAGRTVSVGTNTSIVSAPLVGSHAYSLVALTRDTLGNLTFTLRNPWGFDGAGNDGNLADGLIQLTLAQLQANIRWGAMVV